MGRGVGFIFISAALLVGCSAPRPAPNVKDPDPQVKIAGIRQAVARNDRSVLPDLVQELDSDDPAVRLFAIQALERFAGNRMGYEYYLDDEQRKPFVAKWQEWLKQQPTGKEPASGGK